MDFGKLPWAVELSWHLMNEDEDEGTVDYDAIGWCLGQVGIAGH